MNRNRTEDQIQNCSHHRRNPCGDWSPARALIKWPNSPNDDVMIGLFYPDQQILHREYEKSADWRPVRGVVARTYSLYLEKTATGVPWVDFGIRHYLAQPVADRNGSKVTEPKGNRIAVPVMLGGKNRMSALKKARIAENIWLLFVQADFHNPNSVIELASRLYDRTLGTEEGTMPIKLNGICTLGQLALSRETQNRHRNRRRVSHRRQLQVELADPAT